MFGCDKFSRLLSEREDRELTPAEERFMAHHREQCAECMAVEEASSPALDILRACALEPEVDASFDERLIRKIQVQKRSESLGYWSPAFVGAGIACVALFVALHLAATPTQMHRANLPTGEARREDPSRLPANLELRRIPEFTR